LTCGAPTYRTAGHPGGPRWPAICRGSADDGRPP
jgi:hypothetical protein